MRVLRFVVSISVVAIAACATSVPAPPPGPATPSPEAVAIAPFEARYLLVWDSHRIGDAHESLRAAAKGGWEFERTERISLLRAGEPVQLRTSIRVALTRSLRANRVEVVRVTGTAEHRGTAERDVDGRWHASYGSEPPRALDGDAVPIEVVPLLLGTERRFEGTVMLPGYGFATGELYARPDAVDQSRVVASLVTPAGVLTQELWLDASGRLERITASEGVGAERAVPGAVDEPFDPPEIVDAASIPVRGAPSGKALVRLVLDRVEASEPPALPAQVVRTDGDRWEITLAAGFNSADVHDRLAGKADTAPAPELVAMANAIARESGARTPITELRALASYTDRLIADDMASATPDARTAFALGRGDCTAHAVLFAAFARARGYAVRLVTGYRLDKQGGDWKLTRHRWAIARIDDQWVPIDPTYGEAPAPAALLGLAVHGSSAAEIAVIDEVAFAGFANADAHFE